MKRVVLAVILVLGSTQGAFASTLLSISDGVSSAMVMDSGGNVPVTYTNANFDGWVIAVAGGLSSSPSLSPFGLDAFSLTAYCLPGAGCNTNNLTITLSSNGFTQVPTNGFLESFSGVVASGSASQSGYFSTGNCLVPLGGCTTTLIGTLGPFSGAFGTSISGGSAGPNPYSLTLVQTITAGSLGVSLDGQIGQVPEPASLLLLGGALCGVGFFVRRKDSIFN